MQELINTYLYASLINNEQVMERVEELSRISAIPTSKLLKFKILLNQIVLSHTATTNNVEHKKYKK